MIYLNGHNLLIHRLGFPLQSFTHQYKIQSFLLKDYEYYMILLSFSIMILLINVFKLIYCSISDGEHMIHARFVVSIIDLIAIISLTTCCFPHIISQYFPIFLLQDCHGRLGSMFVLLEHLITIPSMFYLCISFDCQKDQCSKSDQAILLLVISSVFSTIAAYIVPNLYLIIILYIYSYISMSIACIILNHTAQAEYQHLINHSNEKISAYGIIVRNVANKRRSLCLILTIMCFNITLLKTTRSIFEYYRYEVFFIYNVLFHCNRVVFSTILLSEQREQLYPEYSQLIYEQSVNQSDRKQTQHLIHKIRESMNIIVLALQLAYSNLLSQKNKNSRSLLESFEMIQEGIKFMTGTINDVTSITEMEQGRFKLNFQPFYTISIVKTAVMSLRGQVHEKNIHLHVSVHPNVPIQVIGDASRIEHTLTNFLSNAIKFSSQGSTISIILSYDDYVKDAVTYAVMDDGIGIPYDTQSSVFSTYLQVDANKNQDGKGTGIGLSLCKEMIVKHGGNIGFRSIPKTGPQPFVQPHDQTIPLYHRISSGSIFYFYLPLKVLIPSSVVNIDRGRSLSRMHSLSMNDFFSSSYSPQSVCHARKLVTSRSDNSLFTEESMHYPSAKLSVPLEILSLHQSLQNELNWNQDVYQVMNASAADEVNVDTQESYIDNMPKTLTRNRCLIVEGTR